MCTEVFYRGVKYLSHIFVVKDPKLEFEIGNPTDVKHVAHICADGIGNASQPSWINAFKNGPDFSATSLASLKEKQSSRSSGSDELVNKAGSQTSQTIHKRKKTHSTSYSDISGSEVIHQAKEVYTL